MLGWAFSPAYRQAGQFRPEADQPWAGVSPEYSGYTEEVIQIIQILQGRLAQLVRAPRLHRGGLGFESLSAYRKELR